MVLIEFFYRWRDEMKVKVRRMTEMEALKILVWQYAPPYSWYNFEKNESGFKALVEDDYYCVLSETGKLIGFFCYGEVAQVSAGLEGGFYRDSSYLDIGLGMNPLLCGKGYGVHFLPIGMEYAKRHFSFSKFRLTVASFNYRAIKTYLRVGFKECGRFLVGKYEFIVMIYEGDS